MTESDAEKNSEGAPTEKNGNSVADGNPDEETPEPTGQFSGSTLAFVGTVAAMLVLALGAVGHLSGIGWFGYRQWLYGTGSLYLGNYTRKTRFVSIDGRNPVKLGPEQYETVDIVGGTTSIRVMDAERNTLSHHSITAKSSDAYFKVAGDVCLVASNVTSFYRSSRGKLEFSEFIEADQRSYVPDSHNVIWPGQTFPDRLAGDDGPGIWIEKVGCAHLEDPPVLRGYLKIRLRERMNLDGPSRGRTR